MEVDKISIVDYIETRYAELSRICGEDKAEVPGWQAEGGREELGRLYRLFKKDSISMPKPPITPERLAEILAHATIEAGIKVNPDSGIFLITVAAEILKVCEVREKEAPKE
jgi:hypothetical protein